MRTSMKKTVHSRKKFTAWIVIAVLCLSLLAGCGSASTGGSAANEESTTASEDSNKLFGVVSEVGDHSITIKEIDSDSFPGKGDFDGQPPERPDGDGQDFPDGQPPERPDGDGQGFPDGQPPERPEMKTTGEEKTISVSEDVSLDDIKTGDLVSITLDDKGNATAVESMFGKRPDKPGNSDGSSSQDGAAPEMPGGGQSSQPENYNAVNTYTENANVSKETYKSEGTDENAILVKNGAGVTLDQATVTRSSKDSPGGDNSSFYGVGAAILNTEGNLTIKNSKINTDAAGGAGIFSYGDNAVTYVTDTNIVTKQDTSGGLHVAGGGKLYAWNVNAETSGQSSAAIRSDRGGGTMVVDGGTFTSNGTGSPAVYTTADITVSNADLKATNSEAVCIEGFNTLRLYNTNLTGNMPDNKQNDCTWNIILYQSMSGDSEEGNSTFDMQGGTLTAKNGGMFYTTNTESTFVLNNVKIKYAKDNDFFLKCTGNSNKRGWGTAGENGANSTFTGINQEMKGDVIWDSISTLDFYLTEGSSLTGAVVQDDSNAGSGEKNGYCNVTVSKDSIWTVTGDSTLTTLSGEGEVVDKDGNTVTIKGTDGTVYVEGDSKYTVTVSTYKEKADLSKAGQSSDQSKHTVQRIDDDTVSE